MAGFDPNQPRDKEGQWSRLGSSIASGIAGGARHVGRFFTSSAATKRAAIGKVARALDTGDPTTNAQLKLIGLKAGAGALHAGVHVGAEHLARRAVHKADQQVARANRGPGRPSKTERVVRHHNILNVATPGDVLGAGATLGPARPSKPPTHYSKTDEKGYKINFYGAKVVKKRRPVKHFHDPYEDFFEGS